MKAYILIKDRVDFPIEVKLYSTRKAAEQAFLAEIGAEIQDSLVAGDRGEAIKFITNLHIGESDEWYIYDDTMELYIEEKEIDEI